MHREIVSKNPNGKQYSESVTKSHSAALCTLPDDLRQYRWSFLVAASLHQTLTQLILYIKPATQTTPHSPCQSAAANYASLGLFQLFPFLKLYLSTLWGFQFLHLHPPQEIFSRRDFLLTEHTPHRLCWWLCYERKEKTDTTPLYLDRALFTSLLNEHSSGLLELYFRTSFNFDWSIGAPLKSTVS